MNVVVANDISELDRLHRSVCQFCKEHGLSSEIEGDLNLALEEIVVNVIRYGHPEGGKHEILVWLSLEQDCIVATVEDDGVPFNPLEAPEPDLDSPIETRQIGGLGIHLVKHITDNLEYRSSEGRNRLVIRKHLRGANDGNAGKPTE
jgi:anti-sigma regulatory factor (Ser/Thr protein kinase)